MDQYQVCGTDDQTYPTPCALQEEVIRLKVKDPNTNLEIAQTEPCPSRPRIYSAPDDYNDATPGQLISINCEAKGFPLPDIFWEFHSADGREVLRLPSKFIISLISKHLKLLFVCELINCKFDSNYNLIFFHKI